MPNVRIPRQPRNTTGTKHPNGPTGLEVRKAKQDWKKARPVRRRNYRDAGSIAIPTAKLIISTLPTVQKPSVRSVFGQLGRAEVADLPAHRLSPRQARRLRRRGIQVVQAAVNILKAEEARRAKAARDAAQKAPGKTQCNARTRLGLRCRKSAVADGYCATHGG